MNFCKYFIISAIMLFSAMTANAQNVLPKIKSDIGETALKNIESSEQAFCYLVSSKPNGYNGYTIDNLALSGFCGIIDLNLKQLLLEQLLATSSNIDFNTTERCTIQPRVLLRFVRGVDNTDILLSSPCHSMSIFYSGGIKTYNMKPASELLEKVSTAFASKKITFTSPALLDQLLPIGVAKTSEQRAKLSAPSQAKRNWATQDTPTTNSSPQGWNTIKFK